MKSLLKISFLFVLLFVIFGCTYRYYLGFHGPSIHLHPEQHESVTQDKECLECHDPKNDPEGPPTSHPHFTECLKCHNDEVNTVKLIKTPVADFRRTHNSPRF
jgi:hypothetical protein